jgi:hypothetical protein
VLVLFDGKMTISDEGNLKSDIAAGNVELVVYALKEIIVSIAEFILILLLTHVGLYNRN